jgi:hypothetical protein
VTPSKRAAAQTLLFACPRARSQSGGFKVGSGSASGLGAGAEALTEFLKAYPKTKLLLGPWSGGGGYFDFRLNERYSVLISAGGGPEPLNEGTAFLSLKMTVSIIDLQRRHRLDIEDLDIDNPGPPRQKPKGP